MFYCFLVISALEAHITAYLLLKYSWKLPFHTRYIVTELVLLYNAAFNCVPCSAWWRYIVYA